MRPSIFAHRKGACVTRSHSLFFDEPLSEYLAEREARFGRKVESTSVEHLSASNEIAQELAREHALSPLALRPDETTAECVDTRVDARPFSGDIFISPKATDTKVPGTLWRLRVPFTGAPELFNYEPNTQTMMRPHAKIEANEGSGGYLCIEVGVPQTLDAKKIVSKRLEETLRLTQQYIDFQASQVAAHNTFLGREALRILQQRARRQDSNAKALAALGIPTTVTTPVILGNVRGANPRKPGRDRGGVAFDYDVALSFAGEDRDYVERVAVELKKDGLSVFYDAFEKATLWGKDLYEHLQAVYRERSRYCVLFLSQHYAKKLWTKHERAAAQARAFEENEEYILPARFDDTEIPGITQTLAYVDLRNITAEELAQLVAEKIRRDDLDARVGQRRN